MKRFKNLFWFFRFLIWDKASGAPVWFRFIMGLSFVIIPVYIAFRFAVAIFEKFT